MPTISVRKDILVELDGIRKKLAEKDGLEKVSYSDAIDNLKNKGGVV